MTIEELNKLIKEELDAFLNQEAYMEDGDDDIEVTTDEPAAETGEEALDLLRQIYDMIRPQVEDEMEDGEEPEMDMDDEEPAEEEPAEEEDDDKEEVDEASDFPNYRADYVKDVAHSAEKIKGGLNESYDAAARFKKLANIK